MTAERDIEVKHVVFNPVVAGGFSSPLRAVVESVEAKGWALVKIMSHHPYESVAVFERVGKR